MPIEANTRQFRPATETIVVRGDVRTNIFAAIGDGSPDGCAAGRLKRAKLTIHSVRRDLHRKLGVSDRSELIHASIRLGFICFTEHGIVRPGFKRLLDACPRRGRRRV